MRLAQKLAQESSLPVPPAMTPPSVRYPAAYDDAPMQFPSPVGQPRSGDAAWSAASGRSQAITSRLELLERSAAENSQALDQMQQQLGVIAERVNALAARFEEIAQGLRDTPNYKVREHFVCGSCNSKGSVAAPIKCTECGKINWWGWWPSRGKGER
jgi:hypothetical protein